MKVRYTPRAINDVIGIADYIWEQNQKAALDVERAIETTARLLAEFPMLGVDERSLSARKLLVPKYPYAIYYRIEENEVWILHIRDGRRRSPGRGDV